MNNVYCIEIIFLRTERIYGYSTVDTSSALEDRGVCKRNPYCLYRVSFACLLALREIYCKHYCLPLSDTSSFTASKAQCALTVAVVQPKSISASPFCSLSVTTKYLVPVVGMDPGLDPQRMDCLLACTTQSNAQPLSQSLRLS